MTEIGGLASYGGSTATCVIPDPTFQPATFDLAAAYADARTKGAPPYTTSVAGYTKESYNRFLACNMAFAIDRAVKYNDVLAMIRVDDGLKAAVRRGVAGQRIAAAMAEIWGPERYPYVYPGVEPVVTVNGTVIGAGRIAASFAAADATRQATAMAELEASRCAAYGVLTDAQMAGKIAGSLGKPDSATTLLSSGISVTFGDLRNAVKVQQNQAAAANGCPVPYPLADATRAAQTQAQIDYADRYGYTFVTHPGTVPPPPGFGSGDVADAIAPGVQQTLNPNDPPAPQRGSSNVAPNVIIANDPTAPLTPAAASEVLQPATVPSEGRPWLWLLAALVALYTLGKGTR